MRDSKENFLPVYLLVGEDELKKENALNRLQKHLDEAGIAEFNFERFEPNAELTLDRLQEALQALPVMSDFRLIIFEDVDKSQKAFKEEIISYLDNPTDGVVLALTADKLAKNTRLYKKIATFDKKAIINCEPKKRYELPSQVRAMAVTHNKTITPDAAEYLVSLIGESPVMLDTELKKLAQAIGEREEITYDDIDLHVTRVDEIKPWDLLDALCERNSAKTLQLFSLMKTQNIMGLHVLAMNRIRELIVAKSLAKEGRYNDLSTVLKRPQWMLKNHMKWQRNFSSGELIDALRQGATLEQKLKSQSDKESAFLTWLLHVLEN